MKALLGSVMCLVLTMSQGFAISGGPWGRGQVTTTGIYAGLFIPTVSDNSLGIFSVTIPKTGVGAGAVAFFRNGIFYPNGTIQAIADPDSAVLTGVVQSTFNITFTSETSGNPPTTKDIVITFTANGSIKAKIKANTNTSTTASARIKGTADITYATVGSAPGFDSSGGNSACPSDPSTDCPIHYQVNGFKQSEVSQ